ncbi:GH25 family lysozyme [Lactiplantibacillus modestisalitolerans]|uniref:GH25 family lysozyme n=1 Tax=Lactiplantibacillus modestisalitolerans TaxID=1457219 RepID=A0ABV5WUH5_9LACO|nr:GH25 family lysozyme [Lactiplantibacillus modestisalitolerans]
MKRQRHLRPVYAQTRGARWRRRIGWTLLLTLVIACVWGGLAWLQWRRDQVVAGFNVRGVAVSQNDGYLDFAALEKDGLQFVYLNATSGGSYTDDNYASNYSRVLGTNLGVGVVHTFSFSSSAQTQAAYFKKIVGTDIGNLPIAIHVAYYGDYNAKTVAVKRNQKKLRQLIFDLTNYYDRKCIVWSTPSIARKLVKPVIKKTPLWYDTQSTHQRAKRIQLMHYSDRAVYRQNGTRQEFAGLLFNGSQAQFTRLFGAGAE